MERSSQADYSLVKKKKLNRSCHSPGEISQHLDTLMGRNKKAPFGLFIHRIGYILIEPHRSHRHARLQHRTIQWQRPFQEL